MRSEPTARQASAIWLRRRGAAGDRAEDFGFAGAWRGDVGDVAVEDDEVARGPGRFLPFSFRQNPRRPEPCVLGAIRGDARHTPPRAIRCLRERRVYSFFRLRGRVCGVEAGGTVDGFDGEVCFQSMGTVVLQHSAHA